MDEREICAKHFRTFFIDSENGLNVLLEGLERLTDRDRVVVFFRNDRPQEFHKKLEQSPAEVEWVRCCNPCGKNSMDVQIIVELSIQLASETITEGYIVSRDKGYLPAINYLRRSAVGPGAHIGLLNCLSEVAGEDIRAAKELLRTATSREDVEEAVNLLFGEEALEIIMKNLKRTLLTSDAPLQNTTDRLLSADETFSPEKDAYSCDPVQPGFLEDISAFTAMPPDNDKPANSFIDLPGIGQALAAKLNGCGIENPTALSALGAVEAWMRIYMTDASFSIRWVYSLDAAIKRTSLDDINQERRRLLKQEVKARCEQLQHAA